ncbi:hypothetical protein SUGI_1009990 [Cryptomeria japonica]|nr:hypothetical protein SUGI_1009990 [Cryptomeria japonica]
MATSSTGLSTMEQMLESLKKQEEKLVSDFLPPLPLRPLSKARLPSKCRMRIAASAVARGDSFCALTKITRLEEFSRMTVQRGIISIQSAFRSHTKRIKFKKLRSYTIFLQALVRSRIARKEYLILKERNKAASTIQKEIRSRIARKNYATTLEKSNINSGKVSGHFDSVQDKEYDKRRSAVSQGFLMSKLPKMLESLSEKCLNIQHLGYRKLTSFVELYSISGQDRRWTRRFC